MEDRLLDAGLACLATLGGRKTTVKQVSQMAGVNHGLVHYYFGSKEGLMLALYRRMAKAQRDHLMQSKGADGLHASLTKFAIPNVRLIVEFGVMARTMPALSAEIKGELKSLVQIMTEHWTKGDIRDGWLLLSAIVGLAIHADDMGDIDMNYMAQRFVDLLER